MISFFKEIFDLFFNSNTFQKGAALAYYAVFSIFPIIIIVTSILGIFFGEKAVSGELFQELDSILGSTAARQIEDIVNQHHKNYNSILTALIGFATLILSASGIFTQIHNAFNALWNIKAKPKSSILRYFTKHVSSFALLMLLFSVLFISTSLNTILVKYAPHLKQRVAFSYLYEHLSSFVIISILFALMFKFLGDAKIHWRPAVLSGAFTGVLFILGKIGIASYIGHSNLASSFGSASALALIMVWVYYTSQIIFLGASFLEVLSHRMHMEIRPNSFAVKTEKREVE